MNIEGGKDFHRMIGNRVRFARERLGWNQKELSDRLGFKDRQTLSSIETGLRKVSSSELLTLIKVLGRGLEYFTDPFLLVGEGSFCWRAVAEAGLLDSIEGKAAGWIAMYRSLGDQLGESVLPLVPQLGITDRSSFEETWSAAERLVSQWELGEYPARRLADVVEKELRTLVLYVDMTGGVSGAACHLPDFNTILINRREPEGRRTFDFAHELFHIMTWQVLPPERIDSGNPSSRKGKRVEQLANNFAGALLMPRESLKVAWEGFTESRNPDIHERINNLANEFQVTASALYVRLKVLGLLSTSERLSISESRLTWNGGTPDEQRLAPLFSRTYFLRLRKALDRGLISERRASKLLGMTFEEIEKSMAVHGITSEQGPTESIDA